MKADKAQISRLLKTARGQMDGILKMVDEDRYCIDISNQLMATQAILQRVNHDIIRGHLEHCVAEASVNGSPQERREKVEEIMGILDKIMR